MHTFLVLTHLGGTKMQKMNIALLRDNLCFYLHKKIHKNTQEQANLMKNSVWFKAVIVRI